MEKKGLFDIERKRLWFKWRWEFMRRSPEYIKDWGEIKKQDHRELSEEKRQYLQEKYGLWPLQEPSLSFEEICERKNNTWESLFEELWILHSGPPAFEEIGTREYMINGQISFLKDFVLKKTTTKDDVILHIDFSRVNSITALKNVLMKWIDMKYRVRKTHLKETDKDTILPTGEKLVHFELIDVENIPSVLSDIDYSTYIKIGDMKEKENLTNEEIARELWPDKFQDTDDEIANPDGAIRNVSHHYKKYQQLVNGGYKKLSYP